MHQKMAATVDWAIREIKRIQEYARTTGDASRPRWPLIVLRTPKGWTGPKEVDGHVLEGSWRAHQVPISMGPDTEKHLPELEEWLRSYKPEELFNADGTPVDLVASFPPAGTRRMGANPHANGGLLLRDLRTPDFRDFIALGGTIGVGLFMGAASTLKWAGPSVLLAYIIAGLFVFFIMRSMGEMLFLEPVTGSFAVYAHRYMSPFFGYLTAWSYWFMWMAVGISEITAIGVYVQFWFPEMAQWIPALIAVALVALANLAAVRLYGEIEFWFAMIKVTTIIVMIVIGLGVIFFGFGNGGQSIGFSNLTEHGGFFAGGWKGFLTALCIVVASYQGVELIGITAGEAKNPQVTLRSAVGKVLWRILILYVGAIFVIVTIFPWNEIGSNGSPFVLTFAKIGITAAAGIINFVVLTAALSGCNSGMYSCGRMLYALAKNRQLPAAMAKVSRHGVPVAGVAVSIAILLIGSCLNYIIPNPQRVFVYVYSASVLPGMVPWFVILISQLRFRRAHKAAIASHPFRSILFPWANYVTMAFLICVLIGMYFNEDTRMSLFVGLIFMLAVTAIYKVFGLNRHGKAHKLEE